MSRPASPLGQTRVRAPSPTLLARCDRYASELPTGQRIGRFLVQCKLHEGPLTATHLAADPTTRNRAVIRIVHADQKHNPIAEACVRRDARLRRLLGSPIAIPALNEAVSTAGRRFVISPYLTGGSFAGLIERKVRPAQAIALLAALCRTTDALHRHGIVHRAIRPGHVLFDGPLDAPRVRLIGFDLAVGDQPDALEPEFASRAVFDPRCSAPELLRDDEAFDARVDHYSIGVLGYLLLLGTTPYGDAPTVLRHKPLVDPWRRWLSMPRALDLFLRSMVAERPAARPTMRAAHALLEEAADELAARDERDAVPRPIPPAARPGPQVLARGSVAERLPGNDAITAVAMLPAPAGDATDTAVEHAAVVPTPAREPTEILAAPAREPTEILAAPAREPTEILAAIEGAVTASSRLTVAEPIETVEVDLDDIDAD